MIIILFILLGIIGCIIAKKNDDLSVWYLLGVLILIIAVVGFLTCIIAHSVIFLSVDGTTAALQARYDTLIYQIEHHLYEDEIMSVSMRDFMKEITEWNTELANNQALQDNIWVGIFYPNIYNNFNFITL